MKKPAAFIILCLFSCFGSCDKTENGLFIRIENSTSKNLKEVLTNNKSFANVNASGVTSYQLFEKVIDLPSATLIDNNNDTAYAGLIFYDLPFSYLADGKYTLKIFDDTTALSGFNCVYIKN